AAGRPGGERAPAERESEIRMHDRDLECIGEHERGARDDEQEEARSELRRGEESERDGATESERADRDEDGRRDARAQRAAAQLVEGMRAESDREEEREERSGDD